MPRVLLLSMLLVISMMLLGCAPFAEQFTPAVPTVGPLQAETGMDRPERGHLILTSNTNCADIGEMVTFTLALGNDTANLLTLSESSPIDITLAPANWRESDDAKPIQRWSDTDQYPQNIDPVLQPGEWREYVWRWKDDGTYGGQVHGVRANAAIGVQGQDNIVQGSDVTLWIGVQRMPWGNGIECTQLER